jgi:hypothetical protein
VSSTEKRRNGRRCRGGGSGGSGVGRGGLKLEIRKWKLVERGEIEEPTLKKRGWGTRDGNSMKVVVKDADGSVNQFVMRKR